MRVVAPIGGLCNKVKEPMRKGCVEESKLKDDSLHILTGEDEGQLRSRKKWT